jgi:triacylglycerol lipase
MPLPANPFDTTDKTNPFIPNTTRWVPANARALAYASLLAYGPDPDTITKQAVAWGYDPKRVTVIAPGKSVLQAVILGGNNFVVLAFRGTRPDQLSDWMTDADINQVSFNSLYPGPDVGFVHSGFAGLLQDGWDDIYAAVDGFQQEGQPLWVTGHSLGGALAVVATAALTFNKREPVNGLYTFGQPRVGDPIFCSQCDSNFGDAMFRFVNNEDIVTRVPPRIVPVPPAFYGHSGQLRYFDADENLHSDESWWNSFLLTVDVGIKNMETLLEAPVADHSLDKCYIPLIEQYLTAGSPPLA